MNKDKVTELLHNYQSYKYAVKMFETTGWVAIAGTQWSDMPRGGSFGPRAPVKFSSDSLQDVQDYNAYKEAVKALEGALEMLNDEEQSVIRLKWMEGLTLSQIAQRKSYSIDTIKRTHMAAFRKLYICLRFVKVPEIEQIPVA